MFPSDLRGMLNSIVGVMSNIGALFYYFICQLFRDNQDNSAPFLAICILDIILVLFVMISIKYFDYGKETYQVQITQTESLETQEEDIRPKHIILKRVEKMTCEICYEEGTSSDINFI